MTEAFIVDGVRTPIGRYAGVLSLVRPDDLAAHAMRSLLARHPSVPAEAVDEVVLGCANQAGEDNRNVARMATLLAGWSVTVPATTINRLCGSGMDAVSYAARAVRSGEADVVVADEPPRDTSAEALAKLAPVVSPDGTATAGVEPRVMGLGPVPATRKLLARTGVALSDVGVVELNEAFAAQSLVCLRLLGLPDDAEHVNPNGGAIALGHPLGMSGARITLSAARELHHRDTRFALATMCIGVGQGISVLLEHP